MPKHLVSNLVIANLLKEKRTESKEKITQKSIAKILNITFQQVQKYEWGQNRIPVSNLFHLCWILNWDINEFYQAYINHEIKEQQKWK